MESLRKEKRLSKKQKGFVMDYVDGGNATKAVLNHYDIQGKDPEKIASAIAVQNLGKVGVQEAIAKREETLKSALEKQGVTPEKIAEKIDNLLESDEYQAVDKGISHATRIYGVEDSSVKSTGNTYNFLFSKETQADIRELEEKIKARLTNVETS